MDAEGCWGRSMVGTPTKRPYRCRRESKGICAALDSCTRMMMAKVAMTASDSLDPKESILTKRSRPEGNEGLPKSESKEKVE